MIALQLKRPSGTGHHPDARIYFISFDGIKHGQHCYIYHKVWNENRSSLEIRNGANYRRYSYNNLNDAISHALKWANRIQNKNNAV